jgi:hypothetical protein
MELNPVAIFAALVLHVTIGCIWYHPAVFGTSWSNLTGGFAKSGFGKLLLGMAAHVLYTIVLALFIKTSNATTVLDGFLIGALVALGFIGTVFVSELLYGKLPLKLFLIKFGDEFLSLTAAGILLALWR